MPVRKPIAHVEQGGRVYLNDNVRSKPRMTKQELDQILTDAKLLKKRIDEERLKEHDFSYINLSRNYDEFKAVANRTIQFVQEELTNGRMPLLLLPDTGMRDAVYFLTPLLSTIFPDYCKQLKRKYGIGPCIHVFGGYGGFFSKTGLDIADTVRFPEIIRRIPNLTLIYMDKEYNGDTKDRIVSKLNKVFGSDLYNPRRDLRNSKVNLIIYNDVDEELFNHNGKMWVHKNGVDYYGRGPMFKVPQDLSVEELPSNTPGIIKGTYDDYESPKRYLGQIIHRKQLYKLGIKIGREYKAMMDE